MSNFTNSTHRLTEDCTKTELVMGLKIGGGGGGSQRISTSILIRLFCSMYLLVVVVYPERLMGLPMASHLMDHNYLAICDLCCPLH